MGEINMELTLRVVFSDVEVVIIRPGDVLGAESALMDAIDALRAGDPHQARYKKASIDQLRRSHEYKSALALITTYEQSMTFVLNAPDTSDKASGWQLAAEVPLDYKNLGIELSKEADALLPQDERMCQIFWRYIDRKIEIRLSCILPTRPANVQRDRALTILHAWVALNIETQLYETWQHRAAGLRPAALPGTGKRRAWPGAFRCRY